ncbi:hypothetical protein CC80DRAFT_585777 [Byssothecium circinans]|uniref:Uncharacterized protein n=1 Tax=Byssothecium circinans TaxID=147558 RepID=A0A6A5UE02_9PLEO|nr:hypothetical protein CC80DRAFT_585777 [Byssothecium circinans]
MASARSCGASFFDSSMGPSDTTFGHNQPLSTAHQKSSVCYIFTHQGFSHTRRLYEFIKFAMKQRESLGIPTFSQLLAKTITQGMHRSRPDQMSSPFTQENISSSSLEGMERPIRSFKSFIKTAPPIPRPLGKPLPPTPSPRPSFSPPSSTISAPAPTSPAGRHSSVLSWRAPVDWSETDASPGLIARTYSPLLPDPSPELSNTADEPSSSMGDMPRLVPIYERPQSYVDLGPPPRSPPRSPLPAPPTWTLNGTTKEIPVVKHLPSANHKHNSSTVPARNMAGYKSDLRYPAASPGNSVHISVTSKASTKEKAFASLGIGSPRQQTAILEDRPHDPESIPPMERTRADRQYLRGKKLRALNKGSPLADDSWEDTEMDDKTRMLSFSQDYHDLLVDQYQEMNVRAEEIMRSVGPHQVNVEGESSWPTLQPQDGEHLYPQPLSWSNNSTASSPPSSPRRSSFLHKQSQDETSQRSISAGPKDSKHKRISSWVPHRLSVVQARRRPSPGTDRWPNQPAPPLQKHIPEDVVDDKTKDDLRFSLFFPPSKSIGFGKKSKDNNTSPSPKAPPLAASPPSATPLMRLPGGLAVVRHSPSPAPKSETASMTELSPTSANDSDYSPRSENRSSFSSRMSNSPIALGVAVRNTYRSSGGSYYSKRSSGSNTSPQHPLATELANPYQTPPPLLPPPPSAPQTPPTLPSPSASSPTLSPNAWKRLRGRSIGSSGSESSLRPSFLAKAKEARKRHYREARQERLKKSIKVLGPTDPGVVSGYVSGGGGRVSAEEDKGRADSDGDGGVVGGVGVRGRVPGYLTGEVRRGG